MVTAHADASFASQSGVPSSRPAPRPYPSAPAASVESQRTPALSALGEVVAERQDRLVETLDTNPADDDEPTSWEETAPEGERGDTAAAAKPSDAGAPFPLIKPRED